MLGKGSGSNPPPNYIFKKTDRKKQLQPIVNAGTLAFKKNIICYLIILKLTHLYKHNLIWKQTTHSYLTIKS